jgi:hypothetical protein
LAFFYETFTSSRSSSHCEDTGLQNQLSAAQEQHKSLCSILQGAFVTHHTILLGVSGTIYTNHMLEPFKELGLDSQRVRNWLPSLMSVLLIMLPKLSLPDVPFPALLSNLIRGQFQVKPATLLIPIDIFSFLMVEFYNTQY